MALFEYTAIELAGKKRRGVIDADSVEMAKERLRHQQIMVIKLAEFKRQPKREAGLKRAELLDFTRDILSLLRAGLPLYESLQTLIEKYKQHKAHALFLDLADRVKQGLSLSHALSFYPKSFNPLYVAMVTAGEESGSLENVFDELAKLLARQERLKKQLLSALIYPIFLGSFCLLVLAGLFFFVIPSMEELYEGRALHPLTATILSVSRFLQSHLTLLCLGGATALMALVAFIRSKRGTLFLHKLWLKTPFVKEVITESVLIRFCRAFSALLTSGLEYMRSIQLARGVMNHPLFEAVIVRATEQVFQGKKMSHELAQSPLIPPLVSRMLAMAEETGSAARMLGNIADIYEENLEKNLTRFTTLLQPIILLVLGVIVGVVLLAVLLPLTDVSSFVM